MNPEDPSDDLKQIMAHFAAAISAEIDEPDKFDEIKFEIDGRSAELVMDTGTVRYQQEMFINSLFNRLEKEARQLNKYDPQKAVDEEIAPLNNVDVEEEDPEPNHQGITPAEAIKDKL